MRLRPESAADFSQWRGFAKPLGTLQGQCNDNNFIGKRLWVRCRPISTKALTASKYLWSRTPQRYQTAFHWTRHSRSLPVGKPGKRAELIRGTVPGTTGDRVTRAICASGQSSGKRLGTGWSNRPTAEQRLTARTSPTTCSAPTWPKNDLAAKSFVPNHKGCQKAIGLIQ